MLFSLCWSVLYLIRWSVSQLSCSLCSHEKLEKWQHLRRLLWEKSFDSFTHNTLKGIPIPVFHLCASLWWGQLHCTHCHTHTHTRARVKSSASSPWFDCNLDYFHWCGWKNLHVGKAGKSEKVAEHQTERPRKHPCMSLINAGECVCVCVKGYLLNDFGKGK